MKRIVITHVGITALTNDKAVPASLHPARDELRELTEPGSTSGVNPELIVKLRDGIGEFGHRIWQSQKAEKWRREHSSAEIASLSLLDLQPGDEVRLVASATPLGGYCAQIVHSALLWDIFPARFTERKQDPGVYLPPPVTIEGLEVAAPQANEKLREQGLPTYLTMISDLFRYAYTARGALVFNMTSGYRGLIPFATLLATLLGSEPPGARPLVPCSLCYLYEAGMELVWLPALPVQFDRALLKEHEEVFKAAATIGGVARGDAEFAGDDYIQTLYFEAMPNDAGRYRLTTLGLLVWKYYEVLRSIRHEVA
jgi:hypothetical protein